MVQMHVDLNTLPVDGASLLQWWLDRVRLVLGGKLRTVYVHGSLVLDDFCPGWSDVDVCVVVNAPVSEGEASVLGTIHDEMGERFLRGHAAGWRSGQAIEACYIPEPLVRDSGRQMPCYVAGDQAGRLCIGHPLPPFDREVLARFGGCLMGPSLAFSRPTRAALVEQTARMLAEIRRQVSGSPSAIWLCGIQHWLARSLVFWRDGDLVAKSAALRREVAQGSPFAAAFELALRIREEGSAVANQYREALRRQFDACALACVAEIERAMR